MDQNTNPAPQAEPAAQTPAAPAPAPSHEEPKHEAPKAEAPKSGAHPTMQDDKVMSTLAYLGILLLIPLLAVNPKSEVLKFHLRQGILLLIVEVVIMVLPRDVQFISLVPTILSIIAIVKLWQGQQWELPVIGEYAKKIKV